jgi:hypothetical protein
MAAVINDDIWNADLIDYTLKESRIFLIADVDFDLIFSKPLTSGIYIDADDSSVRAKILLPHLQGTTLTAADFNEANRLVHEIFEMSLVNWEIVLPFMYQALVVVVNIRPESHRLASASCCLRTQKELEKIMPA